jgi:hypothetical protein
MKSSFARFAASAASFAWRNASVENAEVNSGEFMAGAPPRPEESDRFVYEWLSAAKAPPLSSIPATLAESNENTKNKVSRGVWIFFLCGLECRSPSLSEGITKGRVFCVEVDMIRPESSIGGRMD